MCTVRKTRVPRGWVRVIAAAGVALLGMVGHMGLVQAQDAYSVLHNFSLSSPSAFPVTPSRLMLGTDGNLYGTTYYGGAEQGSVFRVTPTGTFTGDFYLFPDGGADGAYPSGGLIQDGDGNFYGTTAYGGEEDKGTVFRLSPTGVPITLHAFNGVDGAHPQAALIRDNAGNLYGTTSGCAPDEPDCTDAYGTVFQLTPTGTPDVYDFNTKYTFAGTDGASPQAALIRDATGNLYGTTYAGGASGFGTVFKLTPTNDFTVLHSFTGTDGAHPQAGLIQDGAGNLYGTTSGCTPSETACTDQYGTFFQLTPADILTTLHAFTGTDGKSPRTDLVLAGGYIYGTTSQGGTQDGGVVFALTAPGPTKAELLTPAPGSTLPGSSATFTWSPGTGALQYWLTVGTTAGGLDLVNQGQGLSTTTTVNGLPVNGSTLHIRLYTQFATGWEFTDCTVTAASGANAKATLTAPAPDSTLAGSSASFTWSAGSGALQYWLTVGTTAGGLDLYNQGQGLALTTTVNGLPTNGSTLYIRLYTQFASGWEFNEYTLTAASGANAKAILTTPAPDGTLSGSSVSVTWSPGTNALEYWLTVGTAPGVFDLYNQGQGLSTTTTVNGLPTTGSPLYIRVWTRFGTGWEFNDYTVTAAGP